jgi:hypothetical protein
MTLVMAWREAGISRAWIVSDSRLSQPGREGHIPLTDGAAKLLSVELVLRRQTPLVVLGTPVLRRQIAFAYAGSSLIALQAYAAVLPLWAHLQTSGPEALPSIGDCARHLGRFVEAYCREVSGACGSFQSCECAILGYDDGKNDVEGWSIKPIMEDAISVELRQLDLTPGAIEIFGSGAPIARQRVAELASARSANGWGREPLQMIRQHLRRNERGDVGGGVQLGYVSESGFELMFDVQPSNADSLIPEMRFRGFDFSEISQVGEAFVNLPGLWG